MAVAHQVLEQAGESRKPTTNRRGRGALDLAHVAFQAIPARWSTWRSSSWPVMASVAMKCRTSSRYARRVRALFCLASQPDYHVEDERRAELCAGRQKCLGVNHRGN